MQIKHKIKIIHSTLLALEDYFIGRFIIEYADIGDVGKCFYRKYITRTFKTDCAWNTLDGSVEINLSTGKEPQEESETRVLTQAFQYSKVELILNN